MNEAALELADAAEHYLDAQTKENLAILDDALGRFREAQRG